MPDAHTPLPSANDEKLFFAYGTLRRGDDNDINRQQPAPRFVGPARIRGTMFHLGGYPGVVLDHTDNQPGMVAGSMGDIVGEVYAVSPALEKVLDAIESEYPAQPDEYFKRSLQVQVNGQWLNCSVYEINQRYTEGKPVIASGDWVKDR